MKTQFEKYGSWFSQTDDWQVKTKKANQSNLGVDWAPQSKSVQQKQHETNLKKYGKENVMQSDVVKQTFAKSFNQKHGVDWPFELQSVQEKSKDTIRKKYDVDNVSQSPEIKAKANLTMNQTCRQKYNVE